MLKLLPYEMGGLGRDNTRLGFGQGKVGNLGELGSQDRLQAGSGSQGYQSGTNSQGTVAGQVGGTDVVD